ncbi:MAG: transporter [Planctomycetes bacterium]|nr:transporter [Planctomycetota bacterium]
MLSSLPRATRPALAAAVLLLATGSAHAQLRTGHATPGMFGLESAKVPPLGLSYENATVFYAASTMRDRDGNSVGAGSIRALANHNTLTYVTPWMLLGGNLVLRADVPIVNAAPHPFTTDLASAGLRLGDVYLQPVCMYWESTNHLVTFGYGLYLDTGDFEYASRKNAGKGFSTQEVSLGLTYYPSQRRDWHWSALARYEMHGSIDGADLTPGDDVVVDWGVGKHLNERWNAGLVGYGVWETSFEGGADGNGDVGFYGTAAFGAEVRRAMPSWGGDLVMRGYYEFNSYNHPEGQMLYLGLNVRF